MDSLIAGIDIGGSHITAALIDTATWAIVNGSQKRTFIDSRASLQDIIDNWANIISSILPQYRSLRIGIAMPGPFDYDTGISYIKEQGKYATLYGVNVKMLLAEKLRMPVHHIRFDNDAVCFLRGEVLAGAYPHNSKIIGITLGTGLGAAVYTDGRTTDASLWNTSFNDSIAEDYLSTRWFLKRYHALTGEQVQHVQELKEKGVEKIVKQVFDEFGNNLHSFLSSVLRTEAPTQIILGGNIAKGYSLFNHALAQLNTPVVISSLGEEASLLGAAGCWHATEKNTSSFAEYFKRPSKDNVF